MGRLIDADRLKAHYCWWAGGSKEMSIDEAKKTFDTIIDVQPTVDAEPVRHGHWIYDFSSPLKCSSCGIKSKANEITLRTDFKFCPYCGAKMDGERREDAETD